MGPLSAQHSGRWMAGIWLVYVGFIFMDPYLSRAPPWKWGVALLSIAVFLPLYFGAFNCVRRQARRAIWMTVAIAALGLVLLPVNVGGCTYAIYSASLSGFVFRRRLHALSYIVGLSATLVAVLFLTQSSLEWWMLFQVTLVLMVGGANTLAAEERRRNAVVRRAQEEVEELAKLAERERIARDLHDVLGHTLSVIALKSELAAKLADIDPQRAFQEIREVERVSREALTEVRSAVEGYRGRGFRGELQSAAQALGAAGVTLEADVAALTLPAKQETVLALALREAITNIVRHANASMCRVSLKEQPGGLVLHIQDDGVGGVPREGHGLAGMRERVVALGGTLTVDGAHGLSLTVTVP